MKWLKAHWKAPAVVLILLLVWTLWYTRPVDIHGLGMGELESVSASVIHNKPGQGVDLVWSTGAVPDDSQWQTVLKEVERLRFRRPPRQPGSGIPPGRNRQNRASGPDQCPFLFPRPGRPVPDDGNRREPFHLYLPAHKQHSPHISLRRRGGCSGSGGAAAAADGGVSVK